MLIPTKDCRYIYLIIKFFQLIDLIISFGVVNCNQHQADSNWSVELSSVTTLAPLSGQHKNTSYDYNHHDVKTNQQDATSGPLVPFVANEQKESSTFINQDQLFDDLPNGDLFGPRQLNAAAASLFNTSGQQQPKQRVNFPRSEQTKWQPTLMLSSSNEGGHQQIPSPIAMPQATVPSSFIQTPAAPPQLEYYLQPPPPPLALLLKTQASQPMVDFKLPKLAAFIGDHQRQQPASIYDVNSRFILQPPAPTQISGDLLRRASELRQQQHKLTKQRLASPQLVEAAVTNKKTNQNNNNKKSSFRVFKAGSGGGGGNAGSLAESKSSVKPNRRTSKLRDEILMFSSGQQNSIETRRPTAAAAATMLATMAADTETNADADGYGYQSPMVSNLFDLSSIRSHHHLEPPPPQLLLQTPSSADDRSGPIKLDTAPSSYQDDYYPAASQMLGSGTKFVSSTVPLYMAASGYYSPHKLTLSAAPRHHRDKALLSPVLIGIGAALISFLIISNLFLSIPLLAMTLFSFFNGNMMMLLPNNHNNNNSPMTMPMPMPQPNNNQNNGQQTSQGRRRKRRDVVQSRNLDPDVERLIMDALANIKHYF